MKYNLRNKKTNQVAIYSPEIDLWFIPNDDDPYAEYHDWQLLETGDWEVMNYHPRFYSEKYWHSLADAYQSYYYGPDNKDRHPLHAFSDGIQHAMMWPAMYMAHWIQQEGYESFMGLDDNFNFQVKWVTKHGFPITQLELYEKFCKHAKTIFRH